MWCVCVNRRKFISEGIGRTSYTFRIIYSKLNQKQNTNYCYESRKQPTNLIADRPNVDLSIIWMEIEIAVFVMPLIFNVESNEKQILIFTRCSIYSIRSSIHQRSEEKTMDRLNCGMRSTNTKSHIVHISHRIRIVG